MKTSIEWCDYNWNPWRGCTKVSPGCEHCYAETMGRRFGVEWGPQAIRVEAGERVWREPFKWARYYMRGESRIHREIALVTDRKSRVFALSMGDWLEDVPVRWEMETGCEQSFPIGGVPTGWLARMLDTIRLTPDLNWILVTKRPDNFDSRLAAVQSIARDEDFRQWISGWACGLHVPDNVCVMTSVEDQQRAEERIPHLLRIPARWHGLSLEPLLGRIDLDRISLVSGCGYGWANPMQGTHPDLTADGKRGPWIDWLVIGGEFGTRASQCNVEWIRDLRDQGRRAGCPVFANQLGSRPFFAKIWKHIKHPKGGDPSEWPVDLRAREWPDGL